jgi:hypothetical protein
VPAGRDPQLHDAPGSRDHYQQHAQHRGEEQRDSQRQVAVRAEVANIHPLPVFQNEDQQQEQHQREERGRNPHPADARASHDMLRRQPAWYLLLGRTGVVPVSWR